MKPLTLLPFLTLCTFLFLGCGKTHQKTFNTKEETRRELFKDSIQQVLLGKLGTLNYTRFKEKYWSENEDFSKIPSRAYAYVKAYRFSCIGECGSQDILRDTHGKEVTLSNTQLATFLRLIQNKKSYGAGTAACFDPKLAITFYDHDGIPMEYIAICLSCNSSDSYPIMKINHTLNEKHINRGFSINTRNELRKMFKEWGLSYEEYSEWYDDPKDWENYKREVLKITKE